jgi:hypothetical protein
MCFAIGASPRTGSRRRAPAPGALDDLAPLLFGQLAEPLAAPDAFAILRHKSVDAALQETDPLAAVEETGG